MATRKRVSLDVRIDQEILDWLNKTAIAQGMPSANTVAATILTQYIRNEIEKELTF